MRTKLLLLLAVCLYSHANCLSFKQHQQSSTCLQKSIGPIEVDPDYEYYVHRAWTAEDLENIKQYGLPASSFIYVTKGDDYYNQRSFKQIGDAAASKFHQSYWAKKLLYRNEVEDYGISYEEFQSTFGKQTAHLFQVQYGQQLVTLKFYAKGSPKQILGWSILVGLGQQRSRYQTPFWEQQYDRISELMKKNKINTNDVAHAFGINRQALAKHLLLSFKNPPQLNTDLPVQFQASIVVLRARQKFIAQRMNGSMSGSLRIIDKVEDRSNCVQ